MAMNIKLKSTRIKIPYRKVRMFEKAKGSLFLPNSIKIGADEEKDYFFTNFIQRDACFKLLQSMIAISNKEF